MRDSSLASPIANATLPPAKEVLVEITVVRTGSGIDLKVDPDVAEIGHADPARQEPPRLPRQVHWKASGMRPGETLTIAAKPEQEHPGLLRGCDLLHTRRSRRSGAATRHPGPRDPLRWEYSVSLYRGKHCLKEIDPTIVVKNDP